MMSNTIKVKSLVLDKVIRSLYCFSKEIAIISLLSKERIESELQELLLNNPEMFFIDGFKLMYSPIKAVIYPKYCYDYATTCLKLEFCRTSAQKLVSRINVSNDYLKALKAHDFLAKNVHYRIGYDRELHTIVGPLTQKEGVCEGFAKTYKYLLDILKIPCLIVRGYGYDPVKDKEESHAWNLVQIDGNWIHVDVTFDTTIRSDSIYRYDYFGLTNDQILLDHRYNTSDYPKASAREYEYYERNGHLMRTPNQMKEMLTEGLHAGQNEYVFKIPDSVDREDLDKKVSSVIETFFREKGAAFQYTLNYNLKQQVFDLRILK